MTRLVQHGHTLVVSTITLYEWGRGPRTTQDRGALEALFPSEHIQTFGIAEAAVAASLYTSVRRPRGRDLDLAIAACAIANGAALWTLNARDFADVPGLRLID